MPLNFGDKIKADTEAAFNDPQPGDEFEEFLTHWVYVVGRDGDRVVWMSASAPCRFPNDGETKYGTLVDFRAAYAYGTIPGYSVKLSRRGRNVDGWLTEEAAAFLAGKERPKPAMRKYTHDELHAALWERLGATVEPGLQALFCPYFVPLSGALRHDWGTVVNPESPQFGKVIFEHDGCGCEDAPHDGPYQRTDGWRDRKREREEARG